MPFKKGFTPWNKGIKTGLVPKSVFKAGAVAWNKGLVGYLAGEKHPMFGKHHTEESKLKMKLNRIDKLGSEHHSWKGGKPICVDCGKKLSNYGYKRCPHCSSTYRMSDPAEVRKVLRRRTMSGLEKRVSACIEKYSLPYRFVGNGDFLIENKNPDFVNINGKKVAVEVYWKRHKDMFRGGEDTWRLERENLFSQYGWKTVFIEGTGLTEEKIVNSLKIKN